MQIQPTHTEDALAQAFAKTDAAFKPSGKWRPLSEDAQGFGPTKKEEDR